MSDIAFNPGVIYVGSHGVIYVGSHGGEMHPLGEVEENNFYEPVTDATGALINETLTSSEATLTLTLTQEKVDQLIEQLLNVRELVLDLVREEGCSRIAHLARHARKHRVRKKNLHRAYQILTREG